MEPPPQLPALRYLHPPPRSKSTPVKPKKPKKPKKKASAHSSDENDFDEIMNSSEEEQKDENSGKGSDKPRK
jgi:hypothetical protein